jgi:hypothetical protein
MVDMAVIGGISNSLNIALNISKAMIGIRDQALIQEKIVELTREIISAQQSAMGAVAAQTALADHIRELEQQIVNMETWEAEKQRYELTRVSPQGNFAYVQKSTVTNSDPPHAICPTCYQRGKKSILQATAGMQLRYRIYMCPECNGHFPMEGRFAADVRTQTPT